jgi:putative colanic acid biosynthesis UDP-glucose lipid carrier transferase
MAGLVKRYYSFFILATRLVDVALAAIVFVLIYRGLFDRWELEERYLNLLIVSCALMAILHTSFYTNVAPRLETFWNDLRKCTLFVGVWFLSLALMAFLFKVGYLYSREFSLWLLGATWFALVLARIGARGTLGVLRKRGYNSRSVVIAGSGKLAHELVRRLREADWIGYRILGLFHESKPTKDFEGEGIPYLGNLAKLPSFLKQHQVDDIFIAFPSQEIDRIHEIVESVAFHSANVRVVPDIRVSELFLLNHPVGDIEGIPVMNIGEIPLQGSGRLVKSWVDKTLSLALLLALSPLLLAIAAGIKLSSPGPILFRQSRSGWNGEPFQVLKFRTMQQGYEENGRIKQACPGDDRVTPFGRLLRHTSLDELPQLFNVLRGEMSLVGPRPHAIQHDDIFRERVATYMYRFKVKPGITGWAQVNGWRGITDTQLKIEKRVEHDLYYIQNWSMWLDLKILMMTLWKGMINKNAY